MSKLNIIFIIMLLVGCSKENHPTININSKDIIFIQPASGLTEEQFDKIKKIWSATLPPKYTKSDERYHLDSDEMRFKELENALHSNKKYIWAVRGGYGSARLFEKLQNMKKPREQKIIIGYSDITFLHLFFNKWGWKGIHGAMPCDLLNDIDMKNFALIEEIISKKKGTLLYENLKPLNELAEKCNSTTGELIGGNLTIFTNSIGTGWQLNGDNKIIFIEDVNINGAALDRHLNHLKQAGIFNKAKCVLFGGFIKRGEYVNFAIKRFAQSINIPVFHRDFFGHGRINYPLPVGFSSKIIKSNNSFNLQINYDFR